MSRQTYQLVCTYVKQEYFISTAYRRASTIESMWYFETMIWEWDNKTHERGQILEMEDSGSYEAIAIDRHNLWVKRYLRISNELPRE